jgi:hypothetical protein
LIGTLFSLRSGWMHGASNTGRKQPELPVGLEEILQWMSDAGLKLVAEHPDLFRGTRWFSVFGRK